MGILDTNYLDQSIDQPDIVAAQDPKFVKATPIYNVSNPHPKYGKDPNILNEFGHTAYPKMIYPNGKDHAGVIANSPEHETQLMGDKPEAKPLELQQQKNTWT